MRRNTTTKTGADLLQGTLDLLILKTLAPGPMHGWGISRRIRQISEEFLRVNQGSLYPALHRMVLKGWIVSEEGLTDSRRRVRFYRLTAAGRRRLGEEMRDWDQMVVAIGSVLKAT
jgi:transcriptional regulator